MFDEISELSVRFYTASPYILLRRLRRPIPSWPYRLYGAPAPQQARRQARVLAGPSSVILKGALIVEYVG